MMIFPATTTRTVETDQEKIRIFLVWGQSHVDGGQSADEVGLTYQHWFNQPGIAVPGCYIWDKCKRTAPQHEDLSTTDSTRSGEAHAWQPLTLGYAGGDAIEPWITEPTDPARTWDMIFANLWRQHTGERIFIVKMGLGGTTLHEKGTGAPYWGVGAPPGTDNLLEVMLDGYWQPALASAITMAGGDRDKVTLGGVISIIGSSDTFSAPAMAAYQANMTACIAHVRGVLAQPGQDTQVPWLIMKSPLPENTAGNPTLRDDVATIRAAQEATAGALTNVTLGDAAGMKYGADNIHLGWEGNAHLGSELFRKTYTMTGYAAPEGD